MENRFFFIAKTILLNDTGSKGFWVDIPVRIEAKGIMNGLQCIGKKNVSS